MQSFQAPCNNFGSLLPLVVLQFIAFPLMLVVGIVYFPFKMMCFKQAAAVEEQIDVEITECESKEPLDELLFVHGWPDCARLWDNQVKVLKKQYRCIVVTMPNCGHPKNPKSWGHSFPDIAEKLAKVVEKHSNKKKVTVVCHDWGCVWSRLFQKRRPDLVSRMVYLDIAPLISLSPAMAIHLLAYQLFMIQCFLIGDPVASIFLKLCFGDAAPHRTDISA